MTVKIFQSVVTSVSVLVSIVYLDNVTTGLGTTGEISSLSLRQNTSKRHDFGLLSSSVTRAKVVKWPKLETASNIYLTSWTLICRCPFIWLHHKEITAIFSWPSTKSRKFKFSQKFSCFQAQIQSIDKGIQTFNNVSNRYKPSKMAQNTLQRASNFIRIFHVISGHSKATTRRLVKFQEEKNGESLNTFNLKHALRTGNWLTRRKSLWSRFTQTDRNPRDINKFELILRLTFHNWEATYNF